MATNGTDGAGRFGGVVFDLDGVLTDTEHLWEENWTGYSARFGQTWGPENTQAMMGMSMPETARYLATHTASGQPWEEIALHLTDWMIGELEGGRLDMAERAVELVAEVAARAPIAIASSAPKRVIETVLNATGMRPSFSALVSSEEVPRGKPSPDVYLEAARLLGCDPTRCLGVEDSSNGIKAAAAAGLTVIAIPNRLYPPKAEILALCDLVAPTLSEACLGLLARLNGEPSEPAAVAAVSEG